MVNALHTFLARLSVLLCSSLTSSSSSLSTFYCIEWAYAYKRVHTLNPTHRRRMSSCILCVCFFLRSSSFFLLVFCFYFFFLPNQCEFAPLITSHSVSRSHCTQIPIDHSVYLPVWRKRLPDAIFRQTHTHTFTRNHRVEIVTSISVRKCQRHSRL